MAASFGWILYPAMTLMSLFIVACLKKEDDCSLLWKAVICYNADCLCIRMEFVWAVLWCWHVCWHQRRRPLRGWLYLWFKLIRPGKRSKISIACLLVNEKLSSFSLNAPLACIWINTFKDKLSLLATFQYLTTTLTRLWSVHRDVTWYF